MKCCLLKQNKPSYFFLFIYLFFSPFLFVGSVVHGCIWNKNKTKTKLKHQNFSLSRTCFFLLKTIEHTIGFYSHSSLKSETCKQKDLHDAYIYNIYVAIIMDRDNSVSNFTNFCLCIYFLFRTFVQLLFPLGSYKIEFVYHSHNARFWISKYSAIFYSFFVFHFFAWLNFLFFFFSWTRNFFLPLPPSPLHLIRNI